LFARPIVAEANGWRVSYRQWASRATSSHSCGPVYMCHKETLSSRPYNTQTTFPFIASSVTATSANWPDATHLRISILPFVFHNCLYQQAAAQDSGLAVTHTTRRSPTMLHKHIVGLAGLLLESDNPCLSWVREVAEMLTACCIPSSVLPCFPVAVPARRRSLCNHHSM
jgi:hypothetical protein